MLFNNLSASASLDLVRYADIDHFRQSEGYARAESIPLKPDGFPVLRANLSLPTCSLSLVRTFPRIINGYNFSDRLVVVVPMNGISSTRINGKPVGQSLILLRGKANCTVYEPEGRLVAILSIRADALDEKWRSFDQGYFLLKLPEVKLVPLQMLIRKVLEAAAAQPDETRAPGILDATQATLFSSFDDAMRVGHIESDEGGRYKDIVNHIDHTLKSSPAIDIYWSELAEELGISIRTMHTAVRTVCGSSPHRYGQLKRIWSVRRQLRTGAAGLTVRASALAHGFWHMGYFSRVYRNIVGEIPSQTLGSSRRLSNG